MLSIRPFLCLIFATAILADFPLYIDELEDLVKGADRYSLKLLDHDKSSPRSAVKKEFDDILANQTSAIKNAYSTIVAAKEARRQAKEEAELAKATALGVAAVYEEIQSVKGDLSLSEREASRQEKTLERRLGRGWNSASSEEY